MFHCHSLVFEGLLFPVNFSTLPCWGRNPFYLRSPEFAPSFLPNNVWSVQSWTVDMRRCSTDPSTGGSATSRVAYEIAVFWFQLQDTCWGSKILILALSSSGGRDWGVYPYTLGHPHVELGKVGLERLQNLQCTVLPNFGHFVGFFSWFDFRP